GDRRDADPGEDHRERERKLDAPEELPIGVAHAARRLADLDRHAAYAGDDVADEDEERVADEADLRAQHGEAGVGDEQGEQGEARDRVEDPRRPGDGYVKPGKAKRQQRE